MAAKQFNQIDVLFTGYSYTDPEDPGCMRANCTCTLIRTRGGRNVIVDTMSAWDGARIVEALNAKGVHPRDVDAVVCTHGHSDHTGCNYLFLGAEWHVVGACVSQHDKYFDWKGDSAFVVAGDDVTVVPTPGHTLACVSVIVRNTRLGQVVGVCGDLFERVEDIAEPSLWLEAGSEDAQSQREQRLRIAEMCDYIIPGHGAGFVVTEEMRQMLREQVSNQEA